MKPSRMQRFCRFWIEAPEAWRIAAIILVGILVGALLLPSRARAEEAVLRTGDSTLRLLETACSHGETLAHLKPEWRAKFKNARATINGKLWFACWIHDREGNVHVLFEDGEEGDFEVNRFKPDGT